MRGEEAGGGPGSAVDHDRPKTRRPGIAMRLPVRFMKPMMAVAVRRVNRVRG
jgi:hypothetical protein